MISKVLKRRNYGKKRNNYKLFENVESELIFGNPEAIPDPWFTYVIPTYKRADLLKETMESVLNQIDIDRPWNVVIVDNESGGRNETEELIRQVNSPRVLYYRNRENIGVCGNYNRCIELAQAEWIGMIHADDLLLSDHLKTVAGFIDDASKKRKKCAYISMNYRDFTDSTNISLLREDNPQDVELFKNKLRRFTKTQAVITGYSVSLPSFGTVMNREIMLREGGFDDDLGICEDVIIPYRMAGRYAVYVPPCLMGFHRNDRNESVKTETIFKICEEMSMFREYMYSRNIASRIWGTFARGPHFFSLIRYCIYLSSLGNNPLSEEDFMYIYPDQNKISDRNVIHAFINDIYCRAVGCMTFESELDIYISEMLPELKRNKEKKIYIYGAGNAGKYIHNELVKKYKIEISGFMVSDLSNVQKNNINRIVQIDSINDRKEDVYIIIASALLKNVKEMYSKVKELGFDNYYIMQGGYRELLEKRNEREVRHENM